MFHLTRSVRITAAALVAATAVISAPLLSSSAAHADGTAPYNGSSIDATGQNWYQDQTGLAPSVVTNAAQFGKQWQTAAGVISGQAYGSPVLAAGKVVVATETDNVYSLDPGTGTVAWSRSLGSPVPSTAISASFNTGCKDVTPWFGATATPVVSPDGTTVYVEAVTQDGPGGQYHQRLYALSTADGTVQWQSGDLIPQATGPTNNRPDPLMEFSRPGLLWMDGAVFAAFASHCDTPDYNGRVVRIDTATHAVAGTFPLACPGQEAGVWLGGGAITSDQSGRLFVVAGNGPSGGTDPLCTTSHRDSVVRLDVGSGGTFTVGDTFTPSDANSLDATDKDLGSGPFTLLPSGWDPTGRQLGVAVGKDRNAYLLDINHLGTSVDGVVPPVSVGGAVKPFGSLSVFDGGPSAHYVYLSSTSGADAQLIALKVGSAGGQVTFNPAGSIQLSDKDCRCGSPIVTSNGNDLSTAVVWVASRKFGTSTNNDELLAYPADPSTWPSLTAPIWRSNDIGLPTVKFSRPLVAAGRVFWAGDGGVAAFGGSSSGAVGTLATPASLDFPGTQVGQTATAFLHITNTGASDITLTDVTKPSAPFRDASTLAAGDTLPAGGSRDVTVQFTPTAAGSFTGTYSLTANDGTGPHTVQLSGAGTTPVIVDDRGYALEVSTTSLDLGPTLLGRTSTAKLVVHNPNTVALAFSGESITGSGFGLPAPVLKGTTIGPGASVTRTVQFRPTRRGTAAGVYGLDCACGFVLQKIAVKVAGDGVQQVLGPAGRAWKTSLGAKVRSGVATLPSWRPRQAALQLSTSLPTTLLTADLQVKGGALVQLPAAPGSRQPGKVVGVLYDAVHRKLCIAQRGSTGWHCVGRVVRLAAAGKGTHLLHLAVVNGVLTASVDRRTPVSVRVGLPGQTRLVITAAPGSGGPATVRGVDVRAG